MSVSIFDSRIFRNTFSTEAIRAVFTDEAYLARLVEVEAALARAQSTVGVIPGQAGPALTNAFKAIKLDIERLGRETDVVGYPVLPLIRQLNEQCPEAVAKYIHWGATTQDIMDCAVMLQIRAALHIVRKELTKLVVTLTSLARKYRDTPMAARTHLQHALPTTFGSKLAVYLFPLLTHLDRLSSLLQNNLIVQLGGAAGTLASLGNPAQALKVRSALAKELHLLDPPIPWHSARDTIAEILNFLALVGGSLGKIAYDIIIMSSNEFSEVSEPHVPHRGASSTMPQKRNPISSEIILAASKMLREKASLGLDAMIVDFERASGPWHLEWAAVGEAFCLLVGALHQSQTVMEGLVVNEEAMKRNLLSTKGLIVGEAVMMGLAEKIGRQSAHDVVYEACSNAVSSGRSLLEVLTESKNVTDEVSVEELEKWCNPLNYMGTSVLQVDEVVKLAGQYVDLPGQKEDTSQEINPTPA